MCGSCGRVNFSKGEAFHVVCACGKTLICFGEQKDCFIRKRKNSYAKAISNDIKIGNLNKMGYSEKTLYFEQKYPQKQ